MGLSSRQPIKYFSVPYLYRVVFPAGHWQGWNILPLPPAVPLAVPLSSPSVFSLAACRRHVSLRLPHSLCLGTLRCRPGLWPFLLYLSLNRTSRTHRALLIPFVSARFAAVQVSHKQSITRFCLPTPSESFREGYPHHQFVTSKTALPPTRRGLPSSQPVGGLTAAPVSWGGGRLRASVRDYSL